jgi:LuxR family maltose regulon positive regulatory protein
MPIPKTKLHPPILRQPIVLRPRLTESFTERRPLTLVAAPAGSGKTTLALEWLASNRSKVARLSLDADDNDPIRFINGFISALQMTGLKLRAPSGHRDIKTIITDIINQFENEDLVTFVLDDYHLITERSIHATLEYLLEHIPRSLQLVIVTRETPPLPLARLRARDQLREFHLDELRFTAKETGQFLNQIMGLNLSAQQVQSISQHTQGWVAGLQMAGLSLQSNLEQSIPNANERQFISDYFLTEVFNYQTKEVQSFLLSTSALEKFSAAQCNSIYSGNTGKILAYLEKTNLFITEVDKWYQYHPLFREFLLTRLHSNFPERLKELHEKSRRWLEENGFLAEAIPHALAIADAESAARLTARLAPDYLKRGELVILRRWLDLIPDSIKWTYPRLCLTQIWLLLDSNLRTEAQTYLDNLGGFLENNLGAEYLAVRALHAAMTHEPELALQLAGQAQDTPEAKDPFIQTYVAFALGAAQKMALNFFQSEQSFRTALALADSAENFYIAISALANLSDVQYMQARLADSEKTCIEALERFPDNLPDSNEWYWTLGRIAYQRNKLDEALTCVNRAIDLCSEWRNSPTQHARALLQRSLIHYALGNKTAAQEDLNSADTMSRSLEEILILRSIIRQRVLFAVDDGDLDGGRRWLVTLEEYDEQPFPFYFAFAKGRVFLAEGKIREANSMLQLAIKQLDDLDFTLVRVEILTWRAAALQKLGEGIQAAQMLDEAMKLAKRENIIRPLIEAQQGLVPILEESGARLEREGVAWVLENVNQNRKPAQEEARSVRPGLSRSAALRASQSKGPDLTRRETEILHLLAIGLSNQEMAEKLFIAEGTLKRHVANLYQKLGVHNRAQAIRHLIHNST